MSGAPASDGANGAARDAGRARDRARWGRILSRALPLLLGSLLGAVLTWQYNLALRDHRESVVHAQAVLLATGRVAILEETAKTAERSFALTGDASFLDSFFPSLEALPATAQRLEALVAADPRQAANAAVVADLVAVRARQMWESVEARRRHGVRAARNAVQNPQSRETDRRLTEVLDTISRAERAVLADRQADVTRLERFLILTGVVTGALSFLVRGTPRVLRQRRLRATKARAAGSVPA